MPDRELPPIDHTGSLGQWRSLTETLQQAWLERAAAIHFSEGGRPDAAPNTTFVLDGAAIQTLTSFFCAVGEAVNGVGGYFGSTVQAFDDCLVGGFGAACPSTFRWQRASLSKKHLGYPAFCQYLSSQLDAGKYWDSDGKPWLLTSLRG